VTNKKITILDCTLRDGGYYNNWDFNKKIVERYLLSTKNSLVDVVELGFRSPPRDIFMGPYAYTTDDFINQLNLPKKLLYGVMINGQEFIDDLSGDKSLIDKLFQRKENSQISLVRIAINFNDVLKSKALVYQLKNLGYMIGLNLMQAHGKSEENYVEIAKNISSWGGVDVLYFADSLGNMTPKDIKKICQFIRKGWSGQLGVHAHNNKNLALINSLTAIDNGATWCDSTMVGIGRGAGNTPTESLILEMSRLNYHNGNANMTQPSVEDFTELKNKYGWGSNLYYHYAANNDVHPSFVQYLLDDKRYENQHVLNILQFLAERESTSYSPDIIHRSIYDNQEEIHGSWDATGWLSGKEVLLVGAGASVNKYKEGILQYIEKNEPAVLFLNTNQYLSNTVAKATVVANKTRLLLDVQQYQSLNHPIILSKGRLGKLIQDQLKGLKILDYGLTPKEGSFDIHPKNCQLERPIAMAYALAVVTQAGASKISLVGVDGYSFNDRRQEEMNEVLTKYMSLKESLRITALTPTTYNIPQSSIFSPTVN
jgi:4-hydroxy 2-oxovalerate aldolase